MASSLPRFLQEATVAGSLAAEGAIGLRDNRKRLNGVVFFTAAGLEIPSQRFTAADINGRLPFSLDFLGGGALPPGGAAGFTRENYPRILEQVRRTPVGGQTVTVGKVGFGPLELGAMTLWLQAGNGITELTSLRTSFNGGDIMGRGFVTTERGLRYRGDLLVHDMSLLQLCNRFPAITGYISGRVDGIASLAGGRSGVKGITGFTDFWAREGSGERMLVSKEFLQRLSGKKLQSFFFRDDRPYDRAEITALLEEGDLTFGTLDIMHTNFVGIRDLSVSIAPAQNRISLDHLLSTIKQATVRGKAATGEAPTTSAPVEPEFKWQE